MRTTFRQLVFCVAVLNMFTFALAAPTAAGLAAHYTFDEGAGAVLKDQTGHGHDGKIAGDPRWVKLARGGALTFDGKDDMIEIPTTGDLDVARQGTIEIWMKPAAHQGGVACWHKGGGWMDQRLTIVWYYGPGLSCFTSDGNYLGGNTWPPMSLNEWIHVAVAWDAKAGQIFQDGRPIAAFGLPSPIDLGGAPLRFGRSEGLGPAHFNGLLGDVKVYSRRLTAAEVADSYAAAAGEYGKTASPGTRTLRAWTQLLLERGPSIILTADVAEFRPITDGMTLDAELRGTSIRKAVPLAAREWSYELTLPAKELAPGDYVLAVAVEDAAGKPLAPPREMPITWRQLSSRTSIAAADGANPDDVFAVVRDGKTQAAIVVPDSADKYTRTAAEWLADYIKQSTGAAVPIVPDKSAPQGNLISVGQTLQFKRAGLTLDGLKYDGGRMVVKDGVLFLFGRDELQFDRQGAKGTCRTVAQFLEECVGVRWYLPGPEGAVVPRRTTVAVPRTLDHVCNPAFGYSHGRYPYDINTAAALANNYRTGVKVLSHGGHSYYGWLPAEKYFKDHPEYFALIGGKRTADNNHLCSTNPDVARILLEGIRKEFDEGYDWVQLGQEDGYARCECPKCEALDNYRGTVTPEAPCERLLLLHKWIADECRKSHPNKTVHLLVYGPTIWPSKKFDKWGDNVVAEMCNWDPDVVDAWQGKVRAMSGYIYWFDTTVGAGMSIHATAAEAAEKMRYLYSSGYMGLYHCIGTNWGLQGPVYYIIGKLLADPYLDYRQLQKEYCLGLFGQKAGPTLNEFYDALYAMPEVHTYIWPQQAVANLEALLARAENQVEPGRPREWVKLVRDQFDFSKCLSGVLTAYRTYRDGGNDKTWADLKDAVERFEQYREKILNYPDTDTDRFFPGHDELCRFLASKYVGYYGSYKAQRAEVLKKGVRGTPIGWSIGGGIAKEPLGLDFTKPPPHKPSGK